MPNWKSGARQYVSLHQSYLNTFAKVFYPNVYERSRTFSERNDADYSNHCS